jgi:uncharacterized membrane protein SpoIIM required for sporulation
MTQYASFGKRFLAALLDGIILSIINILVSFVLGLILGRAGTQVGQSCGDFDCLALLCVTGKLRQTGNAWQTGDENCCN